MLIIITPKIMKQKKTKIYNLIVLLNLKMNGQIFFVKQSHFHSRIKLFINPD
jgi:hypothetical protein